MKKLVIVAISILLTSVAFSQNNSKRDSQNDSIWFAKYQSINGVTKYLGSTSLKQPYTIITDTKQKAIGTIDASGRVILEEPKRQETGGKYLVYNSTGQLLHLVKIESVAFSQNNSQKDLQNNSQKDSIWIAKYQTINGVTKYLGSTTFKQSSTKTTDTKPKVIGTIDAFRTIILNTPKTQEMIGKYHVYNSMGQLLYPIKID